MSTTEGRIAGNTAMMERNEEGTRRRRNGEENDELLVDPLPEDRKEGDGWERFSTIRTPAPQQVQGAKALVNLLVSAGNCRPEVLEHTLACVKRWGDGTDIAGHRPEVRKETRKRIGDGEGPDLFDRRQVYADPKLHAMLELGFHLLLTLCTMDALEAIARRPKQLVMATHHDRDPQKQSVDDVRLWPPEEEMTSEEWRDAWPNLLEILNEVCEPTVYERFRQHHEFLNRQANFKTRFPRILRFDIAVRRAYFVNAKCQPFVVGSLRYCQELTQACSDQAVETGALPVTVGRGTLRAVPSLTEEWGWHPPAWGLR